MKFTESNGRYFGYRFSHESPFLTGALRNLKAPCLSCAARFSPNYAEKGREIFFGPLCSPGQISLQGCQCKKNNFCRTKASPASQNITHVVADNVTKPLSIFSQDTVYNSLVHVSCIQGFIPGTFLFPGPDAALQAIQVFENLIPSSSLFGLTFFTA